MMSHTDSDSPHTHTIARFQVHCNRCIPDMMCVFLRKYLLTIAHCNDALLVSFFIIIIIMMLYWYLFLYHHHYYFCFKQSHRHCLALFYLTFHNLLTRG